jgi:hypothetical protein
MLKDIVRKHKASLRKRGVLVDDFATMVLSSR